MDSDTSEEGSYDAPMDQKSSSSGINAQPEANQLAAERQQRLEKVRQRRSEMAQQPSSVSSTLTKTSVPSPVSIPPSSTSAVTSAAASLRADLVSDAVLFLTNPKVASAPMETKRKFLTQRKGMTEAEVDEAVRRTTSGSSTGTSAVNTPMAAPTPANYQQQMGPYAQPPPMAMVPHLPPPPPNPSLKAIALVVVLCVGVGGALYQLFKRYILSYWFPKRDPLVAKVETLELQLKAAHEQVTTQASDTKEAISVIRSFLETQIKDWNERQKLEELRQSQDEQKLSDLKREVSSVRHLLPSVGNFGRSIKQSAFQMDTMEEIKNELLSLKNAIKSFVSSDRGSLAISRSTSTTSTNPTSSSVSTDPASLPSNPGSSSATAGTTSPPVPEISSAPPTTSTPTNVTSTQTGTISSTRRPPPAWMTAQSATLPAWQMTNNKSTENSSTPTSNPAPNANTSSVEADVTTKPSSVVEESSSAPSNPTLTEESPQATVTSASLADPPYSASYQDILRMVKQGIVPPNVKTDVDDTPRDPSAPLKAGTLSKRIKPWQNSDSTAQPLAFNVEEARIADDLPKEIGTMAPGSDGEDLELSDIELTDH